MFTVKLYRGHTMKLVQGEMIEIFSAGPAQKMDDNPARRTNEVREISVVGNGRNEVFYVSNGPCWAHKAPLNGFSVFDRAYIENERGATTEIVSPY